MLPGKKGVMKIPLEKNILGSWQVEAGTHLAYFRNTREAHVAEQERLRLKIRSDGCWEGRWDCEGHLKDGLLL